VPVVFIHGLWLLSSSWDQWARLFDEAGYAPVSPGWPDDPGTVAAALANPEVMAGAQIIAGRGQSATTVAIGPAPFRGILPVPPAAVKATFPVLHASYAVPAPGAPLFQAVFANLNPRTEVRVDTRNPDRGPLLIISGGKDNSVPPAYCHAAYKLQRRNPGLTEFTGMPDRGHSLIIDSGWREVAQASLDFVRRFA
jgi:pimeloyl-ACP methyl ester carboxylesterase